MAKDGPSVIFSITKEYLEEEYLNKNRKFSEISRDLGCSRETIRKAVAAHGLPSRAALNQERLTALTPVLPSLLEQNQTYGQIATTYQLRPSSVKTLAISLVDLSILTD